MASGEFLAASWKPLGPSWVPLRGLLGASWGLLGVSWRSLGGLLGASWDLLQKHVNFDPVWASKTDECERARARKRAPKNKEPLDELPTRQSFAKALTRTLNKESL